jgi:mercuric ion transport protein
MNRQPLGIALARSVARDYRMQNVRMTINEQTLEDPSGRLAKPFAEDDASIRRAQKVVAAGGILGAIAASSCCIVPLVLFSLGVSGAWIGALTRLAPYQPYFIVVTLVCLGYGYWLVRRARQTACAGGAACSRPLPNRVVTIALVVAALLAVAAVAFDFLAPLILN